MLGQTRLRFASVKVGLPMNFLVVFQWPKSVVCIVPAEWSEWSEWGPCSATCGFGKQSRFRECVSNDDPENKCLGERAEQQACFGTQPCPVSSAPAAHHLTMSIDKRAIITLFTLTTSHKTPISITYWPATTASSKKTSDAAVAYSTSRHRATAVNPAADRGRSKSAL